MLCYEVGNGFMIVGHNFTARKGCGIIRAKWIFYCIWGIDKGKKKKKKKKLDRNSRRVAKQLHRLTGTQPKMVLS